MLIIIFPKLILTPPGHLMCAHQCLAHLSLCNTYSYDNVSMTCSLASLQFLEDPSPGESYVSIMTDMSVVDSLEMRKSIISYNDDI